MQIYFKIPNQSSKGSINTKKRIARDATAPGRSKKNSFKKSKKSQKASFLLFLIISSNSFFLVTLNSFSFFSILLYLSFFNSY